MWAVKHSGPVFGPPVHVAYMILIIFFFYFRAIIIVVTQLGLHPA